MRILVTGGSGFLGGTICRDIQHRQMGKIFAAYYSHQGRYGKPIHLDITDDESVERVLADVKPDMVVHTAYSKKAELQEAVIANGTRRLVQKLKNVRLIHISTDCIFGGQNGPYAEDDEAHPNMEYGRTKLIAEKYVEQYCENMVIVRCSLISGADPLPPRWIAEESKLRRGQKVIFYTNEIRSPIHVDDLSEAILEVVQSDYRGILHIAGPRYMSRFEELQMYVRWRGISEELIGSNVSDGKDRPLNCSLKTDRFQGLFRTHLREPAEYWIT